MTRRKPAVPSNIQAFIQANNTYNDALQMAKMDLAKKNETEFREGHMQAVRNAEVRRNIRRNMADSDLQRKDILVDRRARMAQLFEEERRQWAEELQSMGYAYGSS